MNVRLVVNQSVEKVGDAPARRPDEPRPTLRLIQGGLARPKRVSPKANEAGPPVPRAEPVLRIEEIPIYLRPIPAWVPRLW